jgi:hypothetical protein
MKATEISDPTNGGNTTVNLQAPYIVTVGVVGVADILFHRWNCDAVEAKASAVKGSKAKKTDDIESYTYRNDRNELCLPGTYIVGSIVNAARFKQDPRSPRKSAMDLYKAAIVPLTPLASFGVEAWDYEHRCRVTVQRQGITRTRPAMKAGWHCEWELMCNLPEYVPQGQLLTTVSEAGRLIGIGDFRPTYGRFQVVKFELSLSNLGAI